ncbi:hypothetical protein K0P33_17815 [Pseudomonas sp. ArH3a]|nr:hypothetical protein K0P33_17815 [Pseudomonas sp. ArH3a]
MCRHQGGDQRPKGAGQCFQFAHQDTALANRPGLIAFYRHPLQGAVVPHGGGLGIRGVGQTIRAALPWLMILRVFLIMVTCLPFISLALPHWLGMYMQTLCGRSGYWPLKRISR